MLKINMNHVYNAIEYKGFIGKVTFDNQAGILHGEVVNSPDGINFQGESVVELRSAFHSAIDSYFEYCQKNHREPQKLSHSGKFIVRVDPQVHRDIATLAQIEGISLNQWVSQALTEKVVREGGENQDIKLEIIQNESEMISNPYPIKVAPEKSLYSHIVNKPDYQISSKLGPFKLKRGMNKITSIEEIGERYAESLIKAGVITMDGLLKAGATPKGRKELAEKTGIGDALILEWVNHVDLYRIKGVGSEYSDLLEEAGVDTIPELAQRKASNLTQKMIAVNLEKKLVRKLPVESQVVDWIEQAKKLPRIIDY